MAKNDGAPEEISYEDFEDSPGKVVADSRSNPDTPPEADEGYAPEIEPPFEVSEPEEPEESSQEPGEEETPPEEVPPPEWVERKYGGDTLNMMKTIANQQETINRQGEELGRLRPHSPPSVPQDEETLGIPGEYETVGDMPVNQLGRYFGAMFDQKVNEVKSEGERLAKEQANAAFLRSVNLNEAEYMELANVIIENNFDPDDIEKAYYFAVGRDLIAKRKQQPKPTQTAPTAPGVPAMRRMPPQTGRTTGGKAMKTMNVSEMIRSGEFLNLPEDERMKFLEKLERG
jgi:hypothetical protein